VAKMVVTGAAGFIGSHLVERLLDEGHDVVGIDSFEDFYAREAKEFNLAAARSSRRFELVEARIQDLARPPETPSAAAPLSGVVDGAAAVYHLAAQAGVRSSWGSSFEAYTDNNVLATQTLLEACHAAGVSRVVYASSSSVYGDVDELPMREDVRCRPVSPYGVTKLAAEHLCDLYWTRFGLESVSLRFFTVYGARQRPDMAFNRFIRALRDGDEMVVYGSGEQTRDFTFVDDIVAGVVAATAASPGGIFNLAGGSRVSLLEAIAVLEDVMGSKARVSPRGEEAGDVRDTWADLTRARESLAYEPRVGLADGLAKEAAWLCGG
jgi:nucleoside-diphosphate-sugar epimerase